MAQSISPTINNIDRIRTFDNCFQILLEPSLILCSNHSTIRTFFRGSMGVKEVMGTHRCRIEIFPHDEIFLSKQEF